MKPVTVPFAVSLPGTTTSYQSLRCPTTVRTVPASTTAAGLSKSWVQIVDWSCVTLTMDWADALTAIAARNNDRSIDVRQMAYMVSYFARPNPRSAGLG